MRGFLVFGPVLTGIVLVGCGGDSNELDTLAAISYIDAAGLHAIDTGINDDKTVPADARAKALKLETIAEAAEWPEDLEDEAEAVKRSFAELADSLDADSPDLAKAGAAAKKAHDSAHDFSGLVWARLREDSGLETVNDDGH